RPGETAPGTTTPPAAPVPAGAARGPRRSATGSPRRCGNSCPSTAPPATSPGQMPRPKPSGDAIMDLIAFGTMFLEIVFGDVPALPAPGEEIFADEFAISCGGAVTAASAASRMGAGAGLSTLLGEDLGSPVVEEFCHRARADLSASQRVPGPAAPPPPAPAAPPLASLWW